MTIPILDLKPQYQQIQSEIQVAINEVLDSGQFIMGQAVKQFEQEVANYLGVKYAIGVNSGTDALVIGLRAMGIEPGDEVITTPFSFFATAESISNVGAKPIFVDINPRSFNINPQEIEAKITPKTKAIMPVHLYGQPTAMGQIMAIAIEYNLKVIEDCAQSFGAKYFSDGVDDSEEFDDTIKGKYTGVIGQVGAYSFFPSKNLGAYGDGGLIVTDDPEIAEMAQMLRVHGAKKKYHNQILGYNSRLDTLQAAVLRVKLNYLAEWNQGRRRVAQLYNQLLADITEVITPELTQGHVFHQYTIRVLNNQREPLAQYLASQGIGTMIYYPIPQDQLPIYAGQYPPNPVSNLMATQVLSLPIWPEMEDAKIEAVVNTVKTFLKS